MKDHIVKVLTLSCDATHIRKRLHGNEGIMATYHALFIHITKEGRDEMKQVQTKGIGKTCIRRSGREDDYKRRCNSDIRS